MQYNPKYNGFTKEEFLKSLVLPELIGISETFPKINRYPLRIVLNNYCNQSCLFCYNEGEKKNRKQINTEDLKFFLENSSKYFSTIKLVGGEPLLHPEISEIIDICKNFNPNLTITTNGTNLNTIAISQLKKFKKITISINSLDIKKYKKIHNGNISLERVIDNINNLYENGITNLTINSVLSKKNSLDILEMIKKVETEEKIKKLNIISMLVMYPDQEKIYYNPDIFHKILAEKYKYHKKTLDGRIVYFNTPEKQKIELVYQFCNLGCNICSKRSFFRLNPELTINYCLEQEKGIDLNEIIKKRNKKEIKVKMKEILKRKKNESEHI